MTEFRSRTSGQRSSYGAASPHDRGSGGFVNVLQDAIRENPVSASLIGMGVLWMFMGGNNMSLFGGGGRKSIFRSLGQGVEGVGGIVRDTAPRVGSSVGQAAESVAGTAAQAAAGARQASATISERSTQAAGQAAEAVASAYDATHDAASRAAGTVSYVASGAARAVQETSRKWGSTVQQNIAEVFERQPLLLGAVGIAIGAGIAASLRTTEAENKVMGDASDFVRDAVSEKAAQVKELTDAASHEAKALLAGSATK